ERALPCIAVLAALGVGDQQQLDPLLSEEFHDRLVNWAGLQARLDLVPSEHLRDREPLFLFDALCSAASLFLGALALLRNYLLQLAAQRIEDFETLLEAVDQLLDNGFHALADGI